MKKNLMNAALLGLLIATPACSFVSCKDYDEDFKNVNARLDGLDKAKGELSTEITNLKSALATATTKVADAEKKLADYATKKDQAALQASVENLNTKVAEVASLNTRVQELEAVKAALGTAEDAKKVKELAVRLAAIGSKAATYLTDANVSVLETLPGRVAASEAAVKDYEKRIKALEEKGTATPATPATEGADLKDKVAALEGYKTELEKLKNGTYQTEQQVKDAIAKALEELNKSKAPSTLNLLQTGEVTSMHVRPYDFVDGIESIFRDVYEFNVWSVEAANENGVATVYGGSSYDANATGIKHDYFQANGEHVGNGRLAQDSTAVISHAEAVYDVNPADANVDDTKTEEFSFTSVLSNLHSTRADETPLATVTKVKKIGGGALRVEFTTDAGHTTDVANMVSLTYTHTDPATKTARVVKSDWARLDTNFYQSLMIGKVSNDPLANVDNKLLADNIAAPYFGAKTKEALVFGVENTGKEGVDLAKEVATYATVQAYHSAETATFKQLDKSAADESKLKRAGFHYEYALVKANDKDKSTDFFQITKEGVLKAVYKAERPFENIGKEATVRVTLVSSAGQVAAVGYFTAKVTAKAQVVDLNSDDKLTYNCNGTVTGIKFSLKDLNEALSKAYNYEANVFNGNDLHAFDFEPVSEGSNVAKQYVVKDGVPEAVTSPVGLVEVNYGGSADANYPFGSLSLSIARKYAKINNVGDKYETYVKLVKKSDKTHVFYVKLTWTPKEVQQAPTVEFVGERQAKMWYGENETLNIRIHPDVVKNVREDKHQKFEQDLNDAFLPVSDKHKLVSEIDKTAYPNFAVTHKWVFVEPRVKTAVGVSGNTYELSVSKDGTKFYAQVVTKESGKYSKEQFANPVLERLATGAKGLIATVTPAGLVEFNSNDDPQDVNNNVIAKDLLNKFSAQELADGETLTGRVAYQTYDACGNVVKTTGQNEFDVKFLRPLNVKELKVKTFEDAYSKEQLAKDLDIHKAKDVTGKEGWLTDYRGYTIGNSDKQEQFFDTYSAKVLLAPKSLWITDFSGEVRTLGETGIDKNFILDFATQPGSGAIAVPSVSADTDPFYTYVVNKDHWVAAFKYTTTTANVKPFTIWIPGVLVYKWGELPIKFRFEVGKTINQPVQSRRK